MFSAEFYDTEIAGRFVWGAPQESWKARSLIVLARLVATGSLRFRHGDEDVEVLVPPTYLHYGPRGQEMLRVLSDVLQAHGYDATLASLPHRPAPRAHRP